MTRRAARAVRSSIGSIAEPRRSRAQLIVCVLLAASIVPTFAIPSARGAQAGVNIDPSPAAAMDTLGTGARWARAFMWWPALEPTPGTLDEEALQGYRRVAATLTSHGVHVMWVIVGSPGWASVNMSPGAPPGDPVAYARFVAAVAQRMGSTVAAYEIWNEEDLPLFWGGPADAARYVRLLAAVYPAVKAVAPAATVIFGGLAGNDYAYLERAYAAGARGLFDAVAVHTDIPCELRRPGRFIRDPNGRISRWSFLGYREVRRTMLDHDDDKPLFMTELGWAVSDAPCLNGIWTNRKPAGVSEAKQAADLADAYACLAEDSYVRAGLWFRLDEPAVDDPATGYGLLRADGSQRPAWPAFRAAAAGAARRSCAEHYVGPRVHVRAHRDRRSGALVVSAHIASDLALVRATVIVDRRRLRTLLRPPRSLTVRLGPRTVGAGRHVVTIASL
ncbi:MAG: polysaccharide biosynthesis protein PslG, partial [Solirubrobacteraceae bacterium]|nr:polysaccharide biosynthesis protein PslG [Solirubrobacteraceae bacterium]